jgi:type IV secretion system protein VirB6
MIQNAMMVAGLRSSSRAAGSAAAGSGGGTVRAGVGIPYIAGQATGVAASAAGRVARHGAGAIRTAAYKLAAMRGRC